MNQVPGQPVALAFGGGRLLVYSREPAMLVALPSLESPGAVVLQPSGSGRPVPTRPGSSTEIWQLTLSARSVESTGHALFHVPTHAGIACASCHPEAGEDGHVWRPPEGTRRTPTLRGGLKGTAPFHWGGELSNMDTLMSEVMSHRMGGAEQSPARVAALADWLDAQPALPAPSWLDVDAVARGKALFEGAAACTSCHAGALGTNNATLDVGTGGPFQVPRLVELARRAPYFHDGRIPTLAARFTAAGGGKLHGTVEGLSTAQISDLVAYLASR
jgi:mono/diheme cytochrome c family protein